MLLPQYPTLVAVAIMAVATPAFADDDYDDDDYRRPAQTQTQRYIGQHKASQIALKRIGGGAVQEVDLDRDRRGYEYKVSVDARNGRVLAAYRD